MLLRKHKIKIRRNPAGSMEGGPQYTLRYRNDPVSASRISHEILSAFIGSNDVIIEINTDMSGPLRNQNDPIAAFLSSTASFDLACRKKNVLSEKYTTFLGFKTNSKRQACEALIYIPNSVWRHPDLRECLPLYGAKYYVTDETADIPAKLDEAAGMSEEDKAGAFRVIIFDLAIYSQMGVSSALLSMDDIKGMLGSQI
jgi:hypothetical protein